MITKIIAFSTPSNKNILLKGISVMPNENDDKKYENFKRVTNIALVREPTITIAKPTSSTSKEQKQCFADGYLEDASSIALFTLR